MRDLTIFAADFKPDQGGVAEYAYQLANGLHEVDRLNRVVTTVPQHSKSSYQFDVVEMDSGRKVGQRWGDEVSFLRKLNSLLYLIKKKFLSHRTAINLLREWFGQHVLVTSVYKREAKSVLSMCMRVGVKFSVFFHGLDLIFLKEKSPSLLRKICQGAELLVFNSKATRDLFRKLVSGVATQSYILYPGINPSEIEEAESSPVPTLEHRYEFDLQEKTVILSLARLVKRKGIDIALRALAPILSGSDQYRYVIAGDGPEYGALKSEIETRGLGDKVTLTGEVTDAEKYGLLETSTFFIMPNHTREGDDFEGFGISFIEASYFENVTIGGRSGGAVEAISEGQSGYLIDFEREGAEEDLRALMRRLINDPGRVEKLARQGRSHVLERFQAPDLVAEFARSFDDVAES